MSRAVKSATHPAALGMLLRPPRPARGTTHEYHLGSGGVLGLLAALVGEALPGGCPSPRAARLAAPAVLSAQRTHVDPVHHCKDH